MRVELRERYVDMIDFLGLVLGPSYEVALHDLSMGMRQSSPYQTDI